MRSTFVLILLLLFVCVVCVQPKYKVPKALRNLQDFLDADEAIQCKVLRMSSDDTSSRMKDGIWAPALLWRLNNTWLIEGVYRSSKNNSYYGSRHNNNFNSEGLRPKKRGMVRRLTCVPNCIVPPPPLPMKPRCIVRITLLQWCK